VRTATRARRAYIDRTPKARESAMDESLAPVGG
jgi:hypothetical protein